MSKKGKGKKINNNYPKITELNNDNPPPNLFSNNNNNNSNDFINNFNNNFNNAIKNSNLFNDFNKDNNNQINSFNNNNQFNNDNNNIFQNKNQINNQIQNNFNNIQNCQKNLFSQFSQNNQNQTIQINNNNNNESNNVKIINNNKINQNNQNQIGKNNNNNEIKNDNIQINNIIKPLNINYFINLYKKYLHDFTSNRLKIDLNDIINIIHYFKNCQTNKECYINVKEDVFKKNNDKFIVCGSLYGNIKSLMSLLIIYDNLIQKGEVNLIFLGNYTDIGNFGIEVITIIMLLNIIYSNHIISLRGIHEDNHCNLNDNFGFKFECINKFGDNIGNQLYKEIQSTYDYFPICLRYKNYGFFVNGNIPTKTYWGMFTLDRKLPFDIYLNKDYCSITMLWNNVISYYEEPSLFNQSSPKDIINPSQENFIDFLNAISSKFLFKTNLNCFKSIEKEGKIINILPSIVIKDGFPIEFIYGAIDVLSDEAKVLKDIIPY